MKTSYLVAVLSLVIATAVGQRNASSAVAVPCIKDIVFVLDMSSSVGEENFEVMKDKCKEIVDDHNMGGPFGTRFGVDVFSTLSKTIIKLKDYNTKWALKTAITNKVKYEGGMTNTYLALDRLRRFSFSKAYGHRPSAKKIAIVFTDGKSQMKMKTLQAAKKAKDAGIYILAIGIGNNIDWEEIIGISSGGQPAPTAFRVASFKALKDFDVKNFRTKCVGTI